MKKNVKILKWVAGGIEVFLGIPFVGTIFVASFLYIPLVAMLALHITTLVLSKNEDLPIAGNILGIIAAVLGWIPILSMILHIVTAIITMIEASGIKSDDYY